MQLFPIFYVHVIEKNAWSRSTESLSLSLSEKNFLFDQDPSVHRLFSKNMLQFGHSLGIMNIENSFSEETSDGSDSSVN